MKNVLKSLLLLSCLFVLASCGGPSVEGQWKLDHITRNGEKVGEPEIVLDMHDGLILIETENGIVTGEYELRENGKKFALIEVDDGKETVLDIKQLDEQKLILVDEDGVRELHYNRVAE